MQPVQSVPHTDRGLPCDLGYRGCNVIIISPGIIIVGGEKRTEERTNNQIMI